MNIEIPFILVSADRAELTDEINAGRRDTFERQLAARDLDYKRVEGFYKGAAEVSYVVLTPTTGDESNVLRLARRYGQESVLIVDANRFAQLAFLTPDVGGPDVERIKGVGFWRAASYEEAASADAWTKADDTYYVTTQVA